MCTYTYNVHLLFLYLSVHFDDFHQGGAWNKNEARSISHVKYS